MAKKKKTTKWWQIWKYKSVWDQENYEVHIQGRLVELRKRNHRPYLNKNAKILIEINVIDIATY